MKRIFTIVVLFTTCHLTAQVVNIPDINFKTFLLNDPLINSNNDNEIQASEAMTVTQLLLTGPLNIASLSGIGSFTNLQVLNCNSNKLTVLDVSGLSQLQELYADDNELNTITMDGCTSLRLLTCNSNQLTSLDISSLPALELLYCSDNNQLSALNGNGTPHLKSVSCTGNTMSGITLSGCDSLVSLLLENSHISTLDISGSKKMESLLLDLATIDKLIATNCSGLKTINTGNTVAGITDSLDVTGCANLETIYLQETNMDSLDLGTNSKMKELTLAFTGEGLKYLNIRNGSSLDVLYLGGQLSQTNTLDICADDFEVTDVQNMLSGYPAQVLVSSVCSLPVGVRLEYFSVIKRSNSNLLSWKAPCNTGTVSFTIERGADGIHFGNIGNISATAARCQKPFDLSDDHPAAKNYYRLKITDVDGRYFYSKVLLAENTTHALSITGINNDHGQTTVYFNAPGQQSIQFKMIATDGSILTTGSRIISAGNSQLNLPFQNIAGGVYTFIVYTTNGEVITRRLVR